MDFGWSGGGGGLNGSGTLNTIAMFSPDSTSLGNTIITMATTTAIAVNGSSYFGGTATATSTAHVGGSLGLRTNVSAAASLTLDNTRTTYVFSGTTTTWTLPVVAGNTDRVYFIKNRGSGTLTLNAAAAANEIFTTVAANTYAILTGRAALVINDGVYWNVFLF